MKGKKIAEEYLNKKENYNLDGIFIGMVIAGAVLLLLFAAFYVRIGFLGFPFALIGGIGIMFIRSARITDENYEDEVKRLMAINKIEETDYTLKEYIVGKSDLIKIGKDKRVRTAFYSVVNFEFKNDICTVTRHELDLVAEKAVTETYKLPVGVDHKLIEKSFDTKLGEIKSTYLSFDGDESRAFPVNMSVYDTDAVIKMVTYKR